MINADKKFIFNKEDYVLYLLNQLEPGKSDKIRLNKIAFFVEFAYLYSHKRELSDAKYAAIDNGPVIDGYDSLLKKMVNEKKIVVDNYLIRPQKNFSVKIPEHISCFISAVIKKYSTLNNSELIALSHATDSYKITTDNERKMGKIINKKLAFLETFFEEGESDEQIAEGELPVINKSKLVKYEFV